LVQERLEAIQRFLCVMSRLSAAAVAGCFWAVASTNCVGEDNSCKVHVEEEDASLLQVGSWQGVEISTHAGMLSDETGRPWGATSDMGPLQHLLGKWVGDAGVNGMSIPAVDLSASGGKGKTASFTTFAARYREEWVFKAGPSGAQNVGYENANQYDPSKAMTQKLNVISYRSKFFADSDGSLIHQEDGQIAWNKIPGVDNSWNVSRSAIIPHGVMLLSMGKMSHKTGQEVKKTQEAYTKGEKWSINPRPHVSPQEMKTLCKNSSVPEDVCRHPANQLIKDNTGGDWTTAVEIKMSTVVKSKEAKSLPFLVQTPTINAQVRNSLFNSTFWLQSPVGSGMYTRMQYIQSVQQEFMVQGQCVPSKTKECDLHQWPHYQVSTLNKVWSPPDIKPWFPFTR